MPLVALSGACGGSDDRSGGEGGAVNAAGSGGNALGGSGGNALGGSGGNALAGMGGTPIAGSGGSTAPVGANAIFSGREMTTEKLESSDSGPAYVYLGEPGLDTAGMPVKDLKVEASYVRVSDPKLPAGTTWAFQVTIPDLYPVNVIVGWNFRQDLPGKVWNYFDGSKFAGFSLWGKAENNFSFSHGIYLYDINSTTPEDGVGGTCSGECAQAYAPSPLFGKGQGWKRFVFRFADFDPADVNLSKLGRVDMILGREGPVPNTANTVWITGIEMLTKEDLANVRP